MSSDRVGGVLLVLGLAVGLVASAGLLVGFEPARLPAALLNIAAYKLTFLAAGGLLAAGAIVRRFANRQKPRDDLPSLVARDEVQLGEGQDSIDVRPIRERHGTRSSGSGESRRK